MEGDGDLGFWDLILSFFFSLALKGDLFASFFGYSLRKENGSIGLRRHAI